MQVSSNKTLGNLPRAAGFPLVGSVPNLLMKQVDFIQESWKQLGDIYELDLGLVSIVMLNHPDHAQHILRDKVRNYSKGGEIWESARQVIGDGLLSSEGDFWLRQRRMMQPKFHRQNLQNLTQYMLEAIEDGMKDWDGYAESGKAFDIAKAFNHITMKVIVRAMFGDSLSDLDAQAIGESMAYSLDYITMNMVLGQLPQWMPVPGRRKFYESIALNDEYIYGLLEKRRKGDAGGDLLSMLLHLVDEETGEQMSDKEIRDEAVTIFLAGYDTTAVTMAWTSQLLLKHPAILEKLVQSVEQALEGRYPSFEDLMALAYPRMVLEESLRLYPPAFWLPRTAVEDDVIDGYSIKAGQMVAAVILNIQRHADFWENPEDFNPERFAPDAAKNRHPMAWMPFGGGQRLCIGRDFALMEGTLILTRMMQRYKLLALEGHEAKPAISSTLLPRNGVWVRLEKR